MIGGTIVTMETSPTTQTVSALEMRKKFGSLLDRVAQKGSHITILRGDKPLAVLIPAKEYKEKFQKADRLKKIEEFFSEIEEWQKKNKIRVSQKDAVDAIREMRNSR